MKDRSTGCFVLNSQFASPTATATVQLHKYKFIAKLRNIVSRIQCVFHESSCVKHCVLRSNLFTLSPKYACLN